MTHNFKALGVILAAAFALCAAFASAAQAEPVLTAAKYPAVFTGHQIKHNGFPYAKFTIGEKNFFCTEVTYAGTIKSMEENEVITVTPSYGGCTVTPGSLPMTITTTGCDYRIHGPGEEDNPGHFKGGTIDMICPEGVTGMNAFVYQNASAHKSNMPLCTYVMHPYTNHGEYTGENIPGSPDELYLVANGVQTSVQRLQGSKVLCGSDSVASLTGAVAVNGYEDIEGGKEGEPVGVTLSEP